MTNRTYCIRLPDKTADVIEQKILVQLEKRWFKPSNLSTARQDELNALFEQVLERLDASNKGYVFKLRDAEKTVGANALAFPSGTIVMTDQLVELAKNDVQLAGTVAILQLSYSREFETDADSYALDYLGCDKDGLNSMADFFNIIANIELVDAPPAGTKNNKPIATEPEITTPEPDSNNAETQESRIDSFLATHPASAKRSAVFANHYENECQ